MKYYVNPNDSAYIQSLSIVTQSLQKERELRDTWVSNLVTLIEQEAGKIYTDPYLQSVNKLLAESATKSIMLFMLGVNVDD